MCLIWFFTSHQQYFRYVWTGLPGLNQYWARINVRLAPLNRFKPSSKIFYWPFQGGTSFVDFLCFFSVLYLLCLCAHLFICALWSPAWKGLTSWPSFVVSTTDCEFVAFPLVSWVGCGTWLYRFLIFAPLLTLLKDITQWRRWGSNQRPLGLESSTLPLSHCAPLKPKH